MSANPPSADRASERVMDLLIALVHARRPLQRSEIYAQVHGYSPDLSGAQADAQNVMFERDKQALKEIGVPLETRYDATHGDEVRYWIDQDRYVLDLPGLTAAQHGVLAVAAGLWQSTDLEGPAARALTKLRAVMNQEQAPWSQRPRGTAHPYLVAIFAAVDQGVALSFNYRSGADLSGPIAKRVVEPWATWQAQGAWYLRGYDRDRGEERNFRLSRFTSEPELVPGQWVGPAAARSASRLYSQDGVTAVVELAAGAGAALRQSATHCRRLGEGAGRERLELELPNRSRAVEEICALGNAARVIGPAELAQEVAASHRNLIDLPVLALEAAPAARAKRKGRTPAAQRLTRMLALLAYLEANGPTPLAQVAAAFSVSEAEIEKDVSTLFVSGRPGYFPDDLIDVVLDDEDGVPTLSLLEGQGMARPLTLSASEVTSLVAALRILLAVSANDALVAQTLALVQGNLGTTARTHAQHTAGVQAPAPAPPATSTDATAATHSAAAASTTSAAAAAQAAAAATDAPASGPVVVGASTPAQVAQAVRQALQERRVLGFDYRDSLDRHSRRQAVPLELSADGEHHLLKAWCLDVGDVRNFRLDRMDGVTVGEEAPLVPACPGQEPQAQHAVCVQPRESGWWLAELPIASPCVRPAGQEDGNWIELRAFDARWLERRLLGWGRHLAAWGARSAAGVALLERVRQEAVVGAHLYD
ncbi:MAG: WYL domain-containing protein [Buchananella hordeovulneris]|nr:WYL domain-containing protein [Buchananella hordeovulneris]